MRGIFVSYAKLPRPIASSYQTQTVSTAALALPTIPSAASMAMINIDTNPIKYTVDTTTPTSANGHLVATGGQVLLLSREEVVAWRAIRQGAADASLCVTYYSGA